MGTSDDAKDEDSGNWKGQDGISGAHADMTSATGWNNVVAGLGFGLGHNGKALGPERVRVRGVRPARKPGSVLTGAHVPRVRGGRAEQHVYDLCVALVAVDRDALIAKGLTNGHVTIGRHQQAQIAIAVRELGDGPLVHES